ncbi:hypothetical protein HPB47_012340 [Ixodes persulcatus]|uniref:Uncharacterized protein n=1 Tax=Ixodes persulcatus TaxID=34615 RepID=A0AC60NTW9_IXOPE|nr:hypothetical protein HPB47_012340 [Ixodes persulcatus]
MNGLSVSAFVRWGVRLCKEVFADDEATLGTGAQLRATASTVPPGIDTKLYRPEHSGCDVQRCRPPSCACSSELPPGGLAVKDTPQLVMLTFNHTVHEGNIPFFYKLFGGAHKKNKATGCDISATFFVSADIDYVFMNDFYFVGNEIRSSVHQMPCVVEPCPRDPYPGLWVFPVNVYLKSQVVDGQDREVPCPIGDPCEPQPTTADDTFRYLRSHFDQHYNKNRAPFQLSLSEEWLKDPARQEGYMAFVEWLLQKEDVHLVTMSQALEFMRNPVSLSSYNQHQCERHEGRTPCLNPTSCSYPTTPLGNFRFMRICSDTCPPKFPWLNNPLGH